MEEVRVMVADDHEIVRRGLRETLEAQGGWVVVAEAANGTQALERALESKPHVAILDVAMPELNGFEAARRIRKALPSTEVLILTAHDSEQMAHEAEACGACGYLVKSDAARDLIAAVQSVGKHSFFVGSRLAKRGSSLPTKAPRSWLGRLTTREREIIQLLAEGKGNKDIATRLNISVKTAETHRTNLMRKVGAHSLADLTRFAIRNGLVEP
jgi:DNA-binding NarL/FixJ family response regulator